MRLILLPVSPLGKGGYNKAVAQDIARLGITSVDHAIIYNQSGQAIPPGYDYITRPSLISLSRVSNTLRQRVSTELSPILLRNKVKDQHYSEIFCGDVMMYRAARLLFPTQKIFMRFHNLFLLSRTRHSFRSPPISLKFRFNIYLFSKLELNIFRDKNIIPIFINETEKDFFNLMYPGRVNELWAPQLSNQLPSHRASKNNFIYFGSYAHHQTPGINWFINEIFSPLKKNNPEFELHFWGMGGSNLNNPKVGIYHHGEYHYDGLPMANEGLFINPDLLGGGIKFKIREWLEKGVPFISTPFGVEGYNFQQSENIIIAEADDWLKQLELYFKLESNRKKS